jgi:Tol biopolymer transport system component
MAYVVEGNLYIQDGSNPPIQLIDSGEDGYPIFSDDGEKIVFFRGTVPHDLYAINADGSQEQALVTSRLLTSLGLGYDGSTELRSLAFVPGSHRLLFNTHQLDPYDIELNSPNRIASKKNDDLLLLDIDTGEIKRLLPSGQGGGFKVSPDGSLVAILASGHVDVVGIDGRVIHRNLVTYTPSQPIELWPDIKWTPDSDELIVLLPIETEYDMEGPETRSVWHYAIDGSPAVQVSLDPPPMGGLESVSPDRNWIIYQYFPEGIMSRQVPLYMGNLHDGRTQLYAPDAAPHDWGPDSMHFVYEETGQELFLGVVDGPPKFIDKGGFQGWVDASHFIYISTANEMIVMGEIGGETMMILAGEPGSSLLSSLGGFTFVLLDRGVDK